MNHLRLVFCAFLLTGFLYGCGTTHQVSGTAYSVTYKPETSGKAAMLAGLNPNVRVQTGGRMSLMDTRTQRLISAGQYEPKVSGYFFRLPLNYEIPADSKLCLSIKNASGVTIPVRTPSGSDDGYDFRNPLWEQELSRAVKIAAAKAQLARSEEQDTLARTELNAIEKKYGAEIANGQRECPLSSAPNAPPRPASAIDEPSATSLAPGLCAWKWEQSVGGAVAAMFRDTGQLDAWNARGAAGASATAWTALTIPLTQGDLDLVRTAAERGSLYIQHEKGMQLFQSAHSACKERVVNLAKEQSRQWSERVESQQRAPAQAKQRCETDVQRAATLRQSLDKNAAASERKALTEQIATLEKSEASATDSMMLQDQRCK